MNAVPIWMEDDRATTVSCTASASGRTGIHATDACTATHTRAVTAGVMIERERHVWVWWGC